VWDLESKSLKRSQKISNDETVIDISFTFDQNGLIIVQNSRVDLFGIDLKKHENRFVPLNDTIVSACSSCDASFLFLALLSGKIEILDKSLAKICTISSVFASGHHATIIQSHPQIPTLFAAVANNVVCFFEIKKD